MRDTCAPIPTEPPKYRDGSPIHCGQKIRTKHGLVGQIECIRWNGWVGVHGEWWIHVDSQPSTCIRTFEIAGKEAA